VLHLPCEFAHPNPSIERTRNGMSRIALTSFRAMRVLPLRAAHVYKGFPICQAALSQCESRQRFTLC